MNILYLAASLVGVTLLVGLNIALLGRGHGAIDRDALVRRLAAEWPGFGAGAFAVTKDGAGALIENVADGTVCLAVMRGDSLITRRLEGASVRLARRDALLSLQLRDFTLPKATLDLHDPATAEAWERRLAHA